MSKVILADKAGFCFGVKRAVEEALKAREKYNKNIYTLGPLIHNADVVKMLEEHEIYETSIEELHKLKSEDVIIVRSHGITKNVLKLLQDKELYIVDATCPYVTNIHKYVEKYHELGYSIIILGDKDHPEVVGINGWCENQAIITKNGEDLKDIPSKLCVVSQTTEKQENWQKLLNVIIKSAKEIVAFNTICEATKIRQESCDELSKKVDAMVVIGSLTSSNTTKLYEICKKNCQNTIHVENAGNIPESFYKKYNTIGVTAGASTPDWIIREALLKMSEEQNMEQNDKKHIAVGEVLKGKIISVNDKEAFVNIGYKKDGVLPKEEVTSEDVSLKDYFHEGEDYDFKVISFSNEDGYVVLSRVELEREGAYKEIKDAFDNKTTLKVVIKEVVKGGVTALYKRVRVFIPASHLDLRHVSNLETYISKELEVKIIEFSEAKRGTKIIGSRRVILKEKQDLVEEEAFKNLEEGMTVDGTVERLTDFGAFVDVMGVDGLLHVSELSWGRVNRPSDVLKEGDKIKVYVLSVDKEKKKVSLSLKKLVEDPWKNVEEKYPVGSVVLGKVARFASFGAFIELEVGVDALVHISQISNKRINKPSDVLTVGQNIKAKIVEVDMEKKKIGLSIKEVEEE